MTEVELAALFCAWLGGAQAEAPHDFANLGGSRRVRIDCETPTHVIELGYDHSSGSRDSLHQALFAAHLTGKAPMVVLIDTDAQEGRYEQEMRVVAGMAGVAYGRCSKQFIIRWRMTQAFRPLGLDKSLDDLPGTVPVWGICDVAEVYRASVPLVEPGKAGTLTGDDDLTPAAAGN